MIRLKIFYKYQIMIKLVDSNKRFGELRKLVHIEPVCKIHTQVRISDLRFEKLKYNRY